MLQSDLDSNNLPGMKKNLTESNINMIKKGGVIKKKFILINTY